MTIAPGGQSYDAEFEGIARFNDGTESVFSGTAVATRIGDGDATATDGTATDVSGSR